MSRIFDALKSAQESRSSSGLSTADVLGEMPLPARGAASGKGMGIDLTVYGRSESDEVFYEQAKAIRGGGNGGVLLLAIPVTEGQDLLLINNDTSQEQICCVESVHAQDMQTLEVSVRFPSANAAFWKAAKTARGL